MTRPALVLFALLAALLGYLTAEGRRTAVRIARDAAELDAAVRDGTRIALGALSGFPVRLAPGERCPECPHTPEAHDPDLGCVAAAIIGGRARSCPCRRLGCRCGTQPPAPTR